MVDKKNLNRIKGILSAQKGAEIPKFQTGAKFAKQKGNLIIYSADGSNWFKNLELTLPHLGSTHGFFDVSTPDVKQPYEIPGDAKVTPITAVEKSAERVQAVEQETNKKQIDETVKRVPIKPLDFPPISLNVPAPSLELIFPKAANIESAGMNLHQEQAQKKINRNKNLGNAVAVGTAAFQGIGTAMGASQMASDSDLTKGADQLYNTTAQVVENFGPVGKIVGTAMQNAKIAGDIIQGLGGGTDQQTTTDKWMDSAFFSWNIGMLNGFAGKRADSFAVDQDIASQVGSSYGGTMDDLNDAASKSGKKYGLFSSKARRRANAAITNAKTKQNLMGDIAEDATDQRLAAQSMGEQAGLAYSLLLDGGYNQKYTYAAKHGGMLEWNPVETLEWEPMVELNWDLPEFKEGGYIELQEELEWIPEFKEGGKTQENDIPEIEETVQKNVIPEGALHKNKHHMEHAEGLTKKGIPVIDDDGEQQAEIEHSEIIFTLEVTKKLEEYYEIFYSEESSNKEKEQAAIDAGKLLVFQILENTEDRTGLIESCKEGGTLTLKKTADDLIDEVLDWAPTLVIVEETEAVEKPIKDLKEKTDKEMMKEAIKEVLIELLIK